MMNLIMVLERQRLDFQPILLCGRPLNFQKILQTGRDVSNIEGRQLISPLKIETFEDITDSGKGFNVFVSADSILIAPIGIDPEKAYLHPESPIMFTAHVDKAGTTVEMVMRTKYIDDSYDSSFPRGRKLAHAAMLFLDQQHMDNKNTPTIRLMAAKFIEPGYIAEGGYNPKVQSDNYTSFINLLNKYLNEQNISRYAPETILQPIYKDIVAQIWASQNVAFPLFFKNIDNVYLFFQSYPNTISVTYSRADNFTKIAA